MATQAIQPGARPANADAHPDAILCRAWADYVRAARMLNDTGPDASQEDDAPAWAIMEPADELICATAATTLPGAIVKLRRAILVDSNERWIEEAMTAGDDATLFARAHELDYSERLSVEALEALVSLEAA